MSGFVERTGIKGCANGVMLEEERRRGHGARGLEDQVIVDWLLSELMEEVAVSATIGMLAEFPLELVRDCGLEAVVKALIEEVAEEEMLLRPPGLGDVGRTIRWVNHFGEVENVHVRSSMVAMQDVVNVSAVRLVDSLAGSGSCFDTVSLVRSCDLFRCW